MINIFPDVEIVDLALYFDAVLVKADVHIGYEEALNKQGILVPRLQFEEMVKGMNDIFSQLSSKPIETIVVNGDLKHEFGTISEQEWRNTLKFLDLLAEHCNEIILVKGNHDAILGPIAKKRNVKVLEHYIINSITKNQLKKQNPRNRQNQRFCGPENSRIFSRNKTLITHGNKIPNNEVLKEVSTIIIGHEHPAVSVREGARVEQYKCFLKGKFKGKNLIVQPSFNTMIEGTDLLRDEILSPFLQQDLDNFNVYVVEDRVYEFGKLRNLR